jgi:hypothetical protein
MKAPSIPGYTAGTPAVARSPITLADFARMQAAALFGPDDVRALRQSSTILADQTDAILDVWYGFVGKTPQLLEAFVSPKSREPQGAYLEAVRKRFARWILDTAAADYDQAWLDYQHEIGLRHHRAKKNRTDGAQAADIVPFRYLHALAVPVTTTLRPFLAKKGHAPAEVDAMQAAWVKSVLLQVTLWSHPYIKDGDF